MTRCLRFFALLALVFAASPASASTSAASDTASAYTGTLVDPSLSLDGIKPEVIQKTTAKGKLQQCSLTQDPKDCQDVVVVGPGRGLGMVVGLLLNIFLPFAIGSWVTGDMIGGIVGLVGQLGGVALIIVGYIVAFGSPLLATIMLAIGWILISVGYLVPIFTVIFHHLNRGRGRRFRPARDFGDLQKDHSPLARGFTNTSIPAFGFSF